MSDTEDTQYSITYKMVTEEEFQQLVDAIFFLRIKVEELEKLLDSVVDGFVSSKFRTK